MPCWASGVGLSIDGERLSDAINGSPPLSLGHSESEAQAALVFWLYGSLLHHYTMTRMILIDFWQSRVGSASEPLIGPRCVPDMDLWRDWLGLAMRR
jgi:hypothetical protein